MEAQTLDQEYDPTGAISLTSGVSADIHKTQTFTVGHAGALRKVELYVLQNIVTSESVTFDIRQTIAMGTAASAG